MAPPAEIQSYHESTENGHSLPQLTTTLATSTTTSVDTTPHTQRYPGDHSPISSSELRSRDSPKQDSNSNRRSCRKCNLPLTGQFVRALGGTFHLDCFKCRVSSCHINFI